MTHTTPKKPRTARPAKREPAPQVPPLGSPQLYINRELSLLAFQRRVLEEALDSQNPLLERVKFLAIMASNLDEFFMVRVAGLIAQEDAGIDVVEPLAAIRKEVQVLTAEAHACLSKQLLPLLKRKGIEVIDYASLNRKRKEAAKEYFENTVFPVLTPLAFDPGRPFPHISNLSLNFAVMIEDDKGAESFARVKVPD